MVGFWKGRFANMAKGRKNCQSFKKGYFIMSIRRNGTYEIFTCCWGPVSQSAGQASQRNMACVSNLDHSWDWMMWTLLDFSTWFSSQVSSLLIILLTDSFWKGKDSQCILAQTITTNALISTKFVHPPLLLLPFTLHNLLYHGLKAIVTTYEQ